MRNWKSPSVRGIAAWRLPSVVVIAPVAIAASVAIVAPASAQEGRPVSEIDVRGVKNTNPDVIRLAIRAAGIREGEPFGRDAMAKARDALEKKGLYSSIFLRPESLPDGRVKLIAEVIENPVINGIALAGVRALSAQQLLPLFKTRPGDILNKATLLEDVGRIQRFYTEKGFRAIVSPEFEFDPKTGVLTIPIIEVVVEQIEIVGLQKTQRAVVLRELRTKVGDPYNQNLVQEDLARLTTLNIFIDVFATQPEPGSELGKAKLTIQVQEQRTGQVGVSVGYSVRQRLTGTVSLDETNFRGRAQGLGVSWTVAGGISRNSYSLNFYEPWIDKNNTSLAVSVYDRFDFRFNRVFSSNATAGTDDNQYFEERRGGTLRLSRPLTADRFTRAFSALRVERVRANNLNQNYTVLTDDQVRNLEGSFVQSGDVSALSFGITANPVDNIQNPSTGYFFSPTVEVGRASYNYEVPRLNPLFTPGSTNIARVLTRQQFQNGPFVKYGVDYRRYFSLNGKRPINNVNASRRIIASRVLFGFSSGNLPFSEQYFVGGADNLRGYADDRFWGNKQFLWSNELRLPFDDKSNLIGVLFADIGDAWGANDVNRDNVPSFAQHKTFRPSAGVGAGIRVRTGFGVIRLDLGFGEGGQGRTHFSIGQAF